MKLLFHPEAEEEFLATVNYYEKQEPGVGEDFALETYLTIENILAHPLTWPVMEKDIRRCLVHRFPFAVTYSVDPGQIFILAVMHLRRHPDYWKDRG